MKRSRTCYFRHQDTDRPFLPSSENDFRRKSCLGPCDLIPIQIASRFHQTVEAFRLDAPNGQKHPWMERLDPRGRILTAVLLSVTVACLNRFEALLLGLLIALILTQLSGWGLPGLLRKLLPLNALLSVVLLTAPWSTEGTTIGRIGPWEASAEGLAFAMRVIFKANILVVFMAALVGGLGINTFGHALAHLRVPSRLAQLILFTARYLDVLHREYHTLRAAMKVRGFSPRFDIHTLKSFGYLVGMILVRSVDRSERILAAMKCRGFRGKFYLLEHFAYGTQDLVFGTAVFLSWIMLIALELSRIDLSFPGTH